MLPGYGFSAHIYDDFAPLLTGYRVVALTVRGWPPSDAPASGYTYDAVAEDILTVIDTLRLGPTVLVGHSFGGALITRAAARYPEQVRALVYLDGALQSGPRDSVFRQNPIRRPPPPETSDTTLRGQIENWHRYAERHFYGNWAPALEADLWARGTGLTDQEFARRDSLIRRFGVEDPRDKAQADFTSYSQPALAICALTTTKHQFPWLTSASPEWIRAEEFTRGTLIPFQRRECERFRALARRGEVVELESGHYLFLNRPNETAAALLQFLATH
jgi:pimeloyl-ACP methyl ester carboxylesterase